MCHVAPRENSRGERGESGAGGGGQGVEKGAVETSRQPWWLRGGKVGARLKEGPKDPRGGDERDEEDAKDTREQKGREGREEGGKCRGTLFCRVTMHPAPSVTTVSPSPSLPRSSFSLSSSLSGAARMFLDVHTYRECPSCTMTDRICCYCRE